MTLLQHPQLTDAPPALEPVRRRGWKFTLAALAALLVLAIGAVVGRMSSHDNGKAQPFDLSAYAKAWGSGDANQIRAFYTHDAIMMPFGHILDTLNSHPQPEYWDMNGPALDREASQHKGATLTILEAKQVGNILVTTIRWTFPKGLFSQSENTVITGGDVMHLRDGKIWREFTSFEVYVNGELQTLS